MGMILGCLVSFFKNFIFPQIVLFLGLGGWSRGKEKILGGECEQSPMICLHGDVKMKPTMRHAD